MEKRKVYTPPTIDTEVLTIGVFGQYKDKKPKKIKDKDVFWNLLG